MARVTDIGGVFLCARDPEGNRLELWQPLADPADASSA